VDSSGSAALYLLRNPFGVLRVITDSLCLLAREPRRYFRSESYIGGKSMAEPRVNHFLPYVD